MALWKSRRRCRRCGKSAKVSEFTLDYVYKMVVCQNCVNGRKNKDKVYSELKSMKEAKLKENEDRYKDKPAGWDQEDEYLERLNKSRSREKAKVEFLGNDWVRYTCPKCKYSFTHGANSKVPLRCHYCDSPIKS